MLQKLFSSYQMRGLRLDNRIVVSPMCQYASVDGNASDWHISHLGNFAMSGAGLVITEATAVEPRGRISPMCLGLYSDENQAALSRIVEFCRKYGTSKLGIQLAHAGRKGSVSPSYEPRRVLKPEEGGWKTVSSSPIDDGYYAVPEALDRKGIDRCIRDWVDATSRAARLGFDLIELHFAHGYLVNQFMSPLINTRSDEYGGSRPCRMRFALEIFEACRAAWPADKPMGIRISAKDWLPGGWDVDDSVAFAMDVKKLGCDYICASSGGVLSRKQQITSGPNYQVPFAQAIRQGAGMPSMAVGQITEPQQAEEILESGRADLIAIARRMLYNPRWVWHAAAEAGIHIVYPSRYRSCHPLIGPALQRPETDEATAALERLAEADHRGAAG